ncbi:MAG: hypothetical protein HKO71_00635 [Pseudomonadales bacterium]|nr:hypothetical protein [Pseudomonadales bacterium]
MPLPDPTLTLAAYSGLERAINAALRFAPDLQQRLAQYSGKVIRLECTAPPVLAYIKLGETCSVMQHYAATADVGLSGDMAAWLALLSASDKAASLINSALVINGDSSLLMTLARIGSELDIDWEAQLAEFVGDVPANLAGRFARQSMQLGKQASQSLRGQLDNFVFEQARLLPTRANADSMYQRLRQLEMRIERMQASLANHKPKRETD